MANKVNPPIASLNHLNLPKPLLDFLNQLWLRTGGSADLVDTSLSTAITNISRLNAQVSDLETKQESMRAELNTVRSLANSAILELQEQCSESHAVKNRVMGRLEGITEKLDELEGLI